MQNWQVMDSVFWRRRWKEICLIGLPALRFCFVGKRIMLVLVSDITRHGIKIPESDWNGSKTPDTIRIRMPRKR